MKKIVALMLALVLVLALAATAMAAELTLIIASNQTSPENPYHFGLAKFKEVAEEISGGKIEVICHDGTLGENENELVEKLDLGAAHMVVASPGFMTAIGVPEVDMLSLLYLFDSFDHWEAAMDGEFGATMRDLILDKTGNNFRIMGYWTSSVRDYYGKKEVRTAADMKGMSIRTQTSGVVAEFWSKLGATPSNVAWGELYQALQQGVVDSAENDYTTRLFLMNGNFYDSLSDEMKGWIDEAAKAATAEERSVTYGMMESSKQAVIADGAEVVNYEDLDIESFKSVAIPIQDEFAAKNGMTKLLEMVRNAKK